MTENMERIQNGTVEEVFAMVDDDELMLANEEMVAACKKVISDEKFVENLSKTNPISALALAFTVRLMRSCGENI